MTRLAFCTPCPVSLPVARSIRLARATRPSRALFVRTPSTRVTSCTTGAAPLSQSSGTQVSVEEHLTPDLPVSFHEWSFKGLTCWYAVAGQENVGRPDVVLVHGFGANCRHWRKNIGALAARGWRVFAIDLLGFGLGDMPAPGTLDNEGEPVAYSFDYWAEQLLSFCRNVVRDGRPTDTTARPPMFFVANSIGSMVTMQASVVDPSICQGHIFIDPSLRQLHVRKRSWLQSLTAPLAMYILSYRPIGAYFLKSLARPDQLRRILLMAYAVSSAVDDELVQLLREPILQPGALGVFIAFITYDTGPLPEDLLPLLSCPSLILWGEKDTFEPYLDGLALRHYATVEDFITLHDVGHCGQDEAPDQVNKHIVDFITAHVK